MASRRSPRLQLPLVLLPCPTPQPNSPAIPPSSTSIIQPFRLPVQKPPEIETLVQSRACSVPLLVFASQESGLLPRPLSAEYACVCLGFFFISDIKVCFPLVVLLVTFVDLSAGGEGQHVYYSDVRRRTRTMAGNLGVGSRRRRRVAGKC